MNLLETFESLLQSWRHVFPQQRSFQRAHRLTLGLLICLRSHLTTNAICALGRQFQDWSADYRLLSRSPWNPHRLFDAVIDGIKSLLPPSPAPMYLALDDTLFKKTGRKIPGVSTFRDPLSRSFHVNLTKGLRFVQAAVLLTLSTGDGPARSLPIRFEPAPVPVKPKKKDSPEIWKEYRRKKKLQCLSQVGVSVLASVRQALDSRPWTAVRQLITLVDGSYTNRAVLTQLPERTTLIGRIRKDAKLFYPLVPSTTSKGRPRRYGLQAPTPEQVLHDDSVPVQILHCFIAGKTRDIKVKSVPVVYWRAAGCARPLCLVVIKPIGYRLTKTSKPLYREPAFLICTDPNLPLQTVVQSYVYRWEIECNHRDEKQFIGVAQGQVRSKLAVDRLPQFQVASYSLLLLSSLLTYGFSRTDQFLPLPKWRGKSIRPSTLDLLNLLRAQLFNRASSSGSIPLFDHFSSTTSEETNSSELTISAATLSTLAA